MHLSFECKERIFARKRFSIPGLNNIQNVGTMIKYSIIGKFNSV